MMDIVDRPGFGIGKLTPEDIARTMTTKELAKHFNMTYDGMVKVINKNFIRNPPAKIPGLYAANGRFEKRYYPEDIELCLNYEPTTEWLLRRAIQNDVYFCRCIVENDDIRAYLTRVVDHYRKLDAEKGLTEDEAQQILKLELINNDKS